MGINQSNLVTFGLLAGAVHAAQSYKPSTIPSSTGSPDSNSELDPKRWSVGSGQRMHHFDGNRPPVYDPHVAAVAQKVNSSLNSYTVATKPYKLVGNTAVPTRLADIGTARGTVKVETAPDPLLWSGSL